WDRQRAPWRAHVPARPTRSVGHAPADASRRVVGPALLPPGWSSRSWTPVPPAGATNVQDRATGAGGAPTATADEASDQRVPDHVLLTPRADPDHAHPGPAQRLDPLHVALRVHRQVGERARLRHVLPPPVQLFIDGRRVVE